MTPGSRHQLLDSLKTLASCFFSFSFFSPSSYFSSPSFTAPLRQIETALGEDSLMEAVWQALLGSKFEIDCRESQLAVKGGGLNVAKVLLGRSVTAAMGFRGRDGWISIFLGFEAETSLLIYSFISRHRCVDYFIPWFRSRDEFNDTLWFRSKDV